jgi:hypothetical protein
VNLTEMPPGHYAGLSLPDGRVAIADVEKDDPAAVAAIRRRDHEAVAEWMDEREPLPAGHLFVLERLPAGEQEKAA